MKNLLMKAAFRSKYGTADVLQIREIDKPIPEENEILIKVHAASVNRSDCHVLTGKPYPMRLFTGLLKPKRSITGSDFAGEVKATGSGVKMFSVGDKVMGFAGGLGYGTHAEYITFPETKRIVTMPANITYEQAAGCLEGTYYAAVGINQLKPTSHQKALVYGATGAIGSAYVQFFKYYGVYVTAVCGGENMELVRSFGADKIIDYKTEDFTKDEERYDFVIDAVGKSTFAKCKRLLNKNGVYAPSDGAENLFFALITPLLGGKKVLFPKDNKAILPFIKEVIEKGSFKPVIDRIYPLEKIADAFTYVASGQKIGNVIITI
jgi:NADPH:quinone reductase-like Zn-dependent oxidoreductase